MKLARSCVEHWLGAFGRRDNQAAVRDYADDIVWDLSEYHGWPGRTTYRGIEEIHWFFREWIAPWAEWRWETEEDRGR